jgi:hypothetical protein
LQWFHGKALESKKEFKKGKIGGKKGEKNSKGWRWTRAAQKQWLLPLQSGPPPRMGVQTEGQRRDLLTAMWKSPPSSSATRGVWEQMATAQVVQASMSHRRPRQMPQRPKWRSAGFWTSWVARRRKNCRQKLIMTGLAVEFHQLEEAGVRRPLGKEPPGSRDLEERIFWLSAVQWIFLWHTETFRSIIFGKFWLFVVYAAERHAFLHYNMWKIGKLYILSKLSKNYPSQFVKKL